ncbi:hypothetical protein BX286_4013 [Streptomyces sp. 3211.6]|nr:hypothetical protein BX286_4013 [Streptomyces sp. 3211.6]
MPERASARAICPHPGGNPPTRDDQRHGMGNRPETPVTGAGARPRSQGAGPRMPLRGAAFPPRPSSVALGWFQFRRRSRRGVWGGDREAGRPRAA